MDWDKLRVFHAVAEAGSFTHAGDTLNLSQSAVSRQISALEEALQVPLFHRHARGLILTEQGERLNRTVREVFAKLAMTEALLTESKERPAGRLKVTTTVEANSATTVSTPVLAVASVLVAPLATPVPRARVGALGALVSMLKLMLPVLALGLPATSVALALTLTLPGPKVVTSLLVSTTATGVSPLPVTVLVTLPLGPVKFTATLAPASATTVITPPAAVASAWPAPFATPVPKARVGSLGAARSRTRVGPVLLTLLPAASNNSTLNTPPLAMAVCNSALVGVPSLVV